MRFHDLLLSELNFSFGFLSAIVPLLIPPLCALPDRINSVLKFTAPVQHLVYTGRENKRPSSQRQFIVFLCRTTTCVVFTLMISSLCPLILPSSPASGNVNVLYDYMVCIWEMHCNWKRKPLQCKTTISNVFELIYKNKINERDWEQCLCFCTSTSKRAANSLSLVKPSAEQRCVCSESAALWHDVQHPQCAQSLMLDGTSSVSILDLYAWPENIIIQLKLNCNASRAGWHYLYHSKSPENKNKIKFVLLAKRLVVILMWPQKTAPYRRGQLKLSSPELLWVFVNSSWKRSQGNSLSQRFIRTN